MENDFADSSGAGTARSFALGKLLKIILKAKYLAISLPLLYINVKPNFNMLGLVNSNLKKDEPTNCSPQR
jgi:hypothetical protein